MTSQTKSFLLVILFIFLTTSSYAQLGKLFYGSKYKVGVSATGGYAQDGFGGLITLDYKINKYDFIQFGLGGTFSNLTYEDITIPVNTYALDVGFFYDILRNNNRKLAIAIGAGGSVGYESINKGEEEIETGQLFITTNQMVYGGYAGIDIDIFVIPSIAFNIKGYEFYHINSTVGKLSPYIGAGVKLILL